MYISFIEAILLINFYVPIFIFIGILLLLYVPILLLLLQKQLVQNV